MTVNVTNALERIKSLALFNDSSLCFIGRTALAYYLQHRISEDINIISTQILPYKNIIDEDKPINLTFEEIKVSTLSVMKSWS